MVDQIIESLPKTMTAEAFRQLPETNLPIELLDGAIVVSPTPKDEHQAILGELFALLKNIAPSGSVRVAPLDVYLDDRNVVQPDIFWVGEENSACQLIDGYWHGAPSLVIEILSPSTARRDKTTKFDLYQNYGVQEYWMVDPLAAYIEVWVLQGNQFTRHGVFGSEDTFISPVLGNQPVDLVFLATH